MADSERAPRTPFLNRWSQRKLAASREATAPPIDAAKSVGAIPAALPATPPPKANAAAPLQEAPLPPIDSLSFESDFAAFLRPNVDASLKRQALHKLFSDPRFNVMDGLDVYIDDYGKFVPMSPELVANLNHAKFLFDPPKTRVNELGHVEDVPPDEPEALLVAEAPRADAAGADAAGAEAPGAGAASADAPDPLAGVDVEPAAASETSRVMPVPIVPADPALTVPAAGTAGPKQ